MEDDTNPILELISLLAEETLFEISVIYKAPLDISADNFNKPEEEFVKVFAFPATSFIII